MCIMLHIAAIPDPAPATNGKQVLSTCPLWQSDNAVSIAAALMTAAKAERNESCWRLAAVWPKAWSGKPPHFAIVMQNAVSLAGDEGVGPGPLLCRRRPMTAENKMPRTLLPTL